LDDPPIRGMTAPRWFDPDRYRQLSEGVIWVRKCSKTHESAVRIMKCVNSRVGNRYLVQGLTSGRQWLVGHATLLASYEPRPDAPTL